MRVLLLTHYFEPENGAPQRRWDALIRRIVAAGHEVHVIAPPPHYPSGALAASDAQPHRVGSTSVGDHGATVHRVAWLPHDGGLARRTADHLHTAAATGRRAMQLARSGEYRPDVIIATAPAMETLFIGSIVSRRLGIPLVAEMRDAWPDLVSYTPGLRTRGPVGAVKATLHRAVTALQRGSAHVVTTTDAFATLLRARGIPEVTVIRNGTDVDAYRSVGRTGGDGRLRVLYMGTVGRSQGLELVVRVAARMRAARMPIDLRIVGDGADWRRLDALNRELDAGVDLRRSVPRAEVAGHYAWADSIIVSLRDWEPFSWTVPSKLYEAMASGKHISGVLAGEAATLVHDTRSGSVVAPGDATGLEAMWTRIIDEPARLRIGGRGRAWAAEHVSFDRLAATYLDVLERATRASSEPLTRS